MSTGPLHEKMLAVLIFLWVMQVFHPNIDLDGNICLNILREDWKPVLSINSVLYGLQFLFLVSTYSPHVLLTSLRSFVSRVRTAYSNYPDVEPGCKYS